LAVAGFWMKLFPDLCKINKFEDAGLRITQN